MIRNSLNLHFKHERLSQSYLTLECHQHSAWTRKNHTIKMRLRSPNSVCTKLKCLLMGVIILMAYSIIRFKELGTKKNTTTEVKIQHMYEFKNVVLHLDFKGSPPKMGYLKSLLPKLQSLGVTGLLMEYEDMFPYEGKLVNLSAKNHYKVRELQDFISMAVKNGLDIIPLIQTFGHMEHVLKLQKFQHLRENPLYPDSICPSQKDSFNLIVNMLDQIINFHQKVFQLKYLHIGSDEVYHINKCKKCIKRNHSNTRIYVSHVARISNYIQTRIPWTTVLIWDDMLRKIPMNKWENVKFENTNIEPVYWDYRPSFIISHTSMLQYHKRFKNIWISSAFKGADGKIATYPDLKTRFLNHVNWLKQIANYKFGGETVVYEFSGIILTGWSRYSHMDPPCELLPVSIPSLYLNLLLIKRIRLIDLNIEDYTEAIYKKYLNREFTDILQCSNDIDIDKFDPTNCSFNENILFNILKDYDTMILKITKEISNVESDLSTLQLYSQLGFNNLNGLKENLLWCNTWLRHLNHFKNNLVYKLSYYYNSYFVDEYVNYKMHYPTKMINNIMEILKNMSKVRNWERRQ